MPFWGSSHWERASARSYPGKISARPGTLVPLVMVDPLRARETVPPPRKPVANYVPVKRAGALHYVADQVSGMARVPKDVREIALEFGV